MKIGRWIDRTTYRCVAGHVFAADRDAYDRGGEVVCKDCENATLQAKVEELTEQLDTEQDEHRTTREQRDDHACREEGVERRLGELERQLHQASADKDAAELAASVWKERLGEATSAATLAEQYRMAWTEGKAAGDRELEAQLAARDAEVAGFDSARRKVGEQLLVLVAVGGHLHRAGEHHSGDTVLEVQENIYSILSPSALPSPPRGRRRNHEVPIR